MTTTRKKYRTANLTEDEAARNWANYMRLRRRPEKACWTCKQVFPNNLDYFARGKRGRVGVRCISCVVARPVPTRVKQTCPCCHQEARLVRDRHAQGLVYVLVCSTCLRTVNAMLDMDGDALERLGNYMAWRKRAAASHVETTALTQQPAIGMPDVEALPEQGQ